MRNHTKEDEALLQLGKFVTQGWPNERSAVPENIRCYWNYRDEIVGQNGILYKGQRVIIPRVMRQKVLNKIHYSHCGIEASLRRAREVVFWPSMAAEVKAFIEQCESCNTYQPCQTKEPMLSHLVPNQPWSRIAADLFAWEGMNFVLLVDYYSDWWEIEKLTDLSSKSVVKNIKRIFARFGIRHVLVSDKGHNL